MGLAGCGRLSVAPKSRWSRKRKSAGAAFVSVAIGKAKGTVVMILAIPDLAGLHPRGHIPRQDLRRRKARLDVATLSNPVSHAPSLCHDVHMSGLQYGTHNHLHNQSGNKAPRWLQVAPDPSEERSMQATWLVGRLKTSPRPPHIHRRASANNRRDLSPEGCASPSSEHRTRPPWDLRLVWSRDRGDGRC